MNLRLSRSSELRYGFQTTRPLSVWARRRLGVEESLKTSLFRYMPNDPRCKGVRRNKHFCGLWNMSQSSSCTTVVVLFKFNHYAVYFYCCLRIRSGLHRRRPAHQVLQPQGIGLNFKLFPWLRRAPSRLGRLSELNGSRCSVPWTYIRYPRPLSGWFLP